MASITITSSNITVTGNNLTVNYTTDVTLTKVELTNGSSDYITASTFNQSSATFNIATWDNGTYTSCLLRVTYEITNSYGQIVLSRSTISLNEAATNTFSVKLDSQPTSNQTINLVTNNNNCTIDKTSLTFTPDNYGTNQVVTITGTHDTSSYDNKASTITLSNDNVSSKTVNVTINNIDVKPTIPSTSDGKALDDWDAFNNTYGNYVVYSPSQVGVSEKAIRMTAIKQRATATPIGGTGTVTTKDYMSGAMVSKKAFKYGRFTFKFKLSANDIYLYPMIWTLPDDSKSLMGRPEFDLLESCGSYTNNSIVQTYHTYDSSGKELTNYKQAQTKVDLTKEHTLVFDWTEDNVARMYVDGVLKLTLKDYMTNWKTGEVDYQVWFLNLGLGTYAGGTPNGVGWFEITDYTFEPVYIRDRQKQHYWSGNFTDGTLPSGNLPSSAGDSGSTSSLLKITSIGGGTFSTSNNITIKYTTNQEVTSHYFNMHYAGSDTGFIDGSGRVTNDGNNNYTMTFNAGELSSGEKSCAIKVEDANGKTYIATCTLNIVESATYTITNNLTNVSTNNSANGVSSASSYSAVLTANNGYVLNNVTVTMGGVDITSTAYSNTNINITSVTGNVVITADAIEYVPVTTLEISNVTGGTFTTEENPVITYSTNEEVVKHEFIMNYSGLDTGFTDGTARVTTDGHNYTMTFNAGDLSVGTKNGAIRVTNADGDTVVGQFTLVINEPETPSIPTYTITNELTNVTTSSKVISVTSGEGYNTTLIANDGYTLGTITVTMGGEDITSSVLTNTTITIPNVTANVVINASASEIGIGAFEVEVYGGTFPHDDFDITYKTTRRIVRHYFTTWYSENCTWYDKTANVTTDGNNNYTMTFSSTDEMTAGTKQPALKLVDADGNEVITTFTLILT